MSATAALLGSKRARARRLERLGRDDVGADAEDAPRQRRRERRPDRRCRRAPAAGNARRPAPCGSAPRRRPHSESAWEFSKIRAPAASAARARPCGVLEGVQVSAARVDQTAEIALAAHVRLQLVAIEEAHRSVAVLIVQFASPVAKLPYMPRLDRDVHVIGPVVAVDRVLANQGLRHIERFDRQIEQAARVGRAHLRDERLSGPPRGQK